MDSTAISTFRRPESKSFFTTAHSIVYATVNKLVIDDHVIKVRDCGENCPISIESRAEEKPTFSSEVFAKFCFEIFHIRVRAIKKPRAAAADREVRVSGQFFQESIT
ncbi:hypothetical protein BCON_0648g00020 [Botryotinia convoluta]|uniref:Uncharacterized protein n=1 Tax=Botryotinia convoluta TaxID=54673 RepID=A0A4Z1H496_9HELO|nr:hypothetical protein BCON_0648g00020 [Botryotinia convoluta]